MPKSSTKLTLKKGRGKSYKVLIDWLVDSGYSRQPMVLEPGEFSVRGGIIDIYPANHRYPIRIEYFGDDIDRINSFSIHNQRSISPLKTTQILPVIPGEKSQNSFRFAEEGDAHLMADFEEGLPVVHELYGIGIYKGLVHQSFLGREGEFALIEYKGQDKLYVPLEQLHYLYAYKGGPSPKINSLSDGSWNKTKQRVKKAAEELVEEIYLLYKLRQTQPGFSFQDDSQQQLEMEAEFPFTETPDQLSAILSVKADMEQPVCMDRLICADVGFGKTEVAIRGAFKAVQSNKQVAIIVPTTLLADQHYHVFKDRLSHFDVSIGLLSRFVSKQEQKKTLAQLAEGTVNIVIGTHRLLQKDINFKNLGLLVVDEEQRFGVSHKEAIKQMKSNVDVMTLTATPIPRTLYMALTGSRDFSHIKTPPDGRKPILTEVVKWTKEKIKASIQQELERGGQVFYLYNNVKRMTEKVMTLKKLLPEATILMAHGQMNESELEDIMTRFYRKEADIMVSSTIIENGIDIPNVNTIIMDGANHLGLSQIHQLRGRVGRSSRQGFAILTYEDEHLLTEKAIKRLQAIKSYTALGTGYDLAMKDLELRGAGSMLGNKQHGYLSSVGFDLYCDILEAASGKLRGKVTAKKPMMKLPNSVVASIPNSYIEAENERMAIYQKINLLTSKEDVTELESELSDRYGPVPDQVTALFKAIDRHF